MEWVVTTGKTVGGMSMYPQANLLDRETALRLWTEANTWFSSEEGKKGQISVGQLADLAVLKEYVVLVAKKRAGKDKAWKEFHDTILETLK